MTARRMLGGLTLAMLLLAACTSGDDSGSEESGGGTTTTAGATSTATGPSPGVTDDSIKVGITYVDTQALQDVGLNYDLGDFEGAYNALIDQINADGGINGRQLEAVYAPINPNSPEPAEAACVELTEDEDVFLIMGFFLTDAVLCPVSTHATAVIGGEQTPERTSQAEAPWISETPDGDIAANVIRAFADRGDLDGTVGVYVNQRDQAVLDDQVTPTLEEVGIEPAEVAVNDAPAEDQPALQANIQTIAERFQAAGVDTVLLPGLSAQDWPATMASDDSYRPQLLFLDDTAINAFANNAATTDTSVLEGALAGGDYGPDQERFDEAGMQECVQTITDAGVEVPAPDEAGADPSNQPYQASFFACPEMALFQAWVEAAGEDLNYGTLQAALDAGLEVAMPGDPEPRTYGPPPDADGNPAAFIFAWDEDAHEIVLDEG
jgi:Periplasmic binding protein